MAAEVVTQTSTQARGRALSIQTNLPTDNTIYKSLELEIPAKMASTCTQKVHFNASEQGQKRDKSVALLNDNWRQNRPRVNTAESLKSAPPRKVKFSEDEMNLEMAQKMEKKKLRIDTSVANLDGVRRCRDARDSPLDPDFILTAPATKKEFGFACYGEGAQDTSDGEEDAAPLSAAQTKMSLGPKQRVRLEWIEPAAGEVTMKQSPTDSDYGSTWSSAVGSITPFANSDLGGSDKSYIGVQNPLAELQEIKNIVELTTKDWSMVDHDIRKGLRKFAGFGIPILVESMNDSTWMTKKKSSRGKAGDQAVLNDPAIKSMTLNGQERTADPSSGHDSEKEKSFDAMLYKLQRSSAHRLRSHDPAILACALKRPGPSQSEEPLRRRLSQDSGISGVSGSSPTKASTLNPKATEFFYPTAQKQNPATIPGLSSAKGNRPSVMGLFDNLSALPPQSEVTTDYLTLLEQRVNDMEAHLRRLAMLQAQAVDLQTQGVVQQLNPPPGFAGPTCGGPMFPLQEMNTFPPLLPGDLGARDMVPPPGLAPPPGFAHPSAFVPPGLKPHPADHGMGLHNPGIPSSSFGQIRIPSPPGLQQGVNDNAPAHPPLGFNGSLNDGRHVLPPAYLPPIPPAPSMRKAVPGQLPPGPASTPMYMNHAFGPKPVRKPKGPFRPGDPVQAKHQQEYEAYLEWRRANDLTYAQQCKARQQKRAERQRSDWQNSDETATSAVSLASTSPSGAMNAENGKESLKA